MALSPILVTGATGNVGREVVLACRQAGLAVREGVRHPQGPDQVALDFFQPDSWAQALAGVRAVFLVRPPAIAKVEETLCPFVEKAMTEGVELVQFLSVAGAEKQRFIPHARVEKTLRQYPGRYTLFRPGFFAQNLQDAYLQDIVEDSRIIVPAGHSQVNWIDVRDMAELAAKILQQPDEHLGQAYTLCGEGPVGWDEVVNELSRSLGRCIRYCPVSVPRYIWHLHKQGLPKGAIAVQSLLHFLLRFGQGAKEDATLAQLLGRPPRSMAQYIHDNAAHWRRGVD